MGRIHYSFEKTRFPDVVAATREHLSKIALLDVDPLVGEQLLSVGMEMRELPGVAVGRLWCSPGRARRTATHVADGNDNVMLVMPLDTGMVIDRRGHRAMLCRPGDVFIWACDEPAGFTFRSHCTTLNVSLPRSALAAVTGQGCSRLMTTVAAETLPDIWLLRSYAAMLVAGESLQPEAEHLAAAHLQDLAAQLLSGGNRGFAIQDEGIPAARFRAICAEIVANVGRPLSADEIARRNGISPRYLRALFADAGTSYTEFVREQRLGRARRLLADSRLAHLSIGTIAARCGFNDLAYFSRAFRRQYGLSPSSARAGGVPPAGR